MRTGLAVALAAMLVTPAVVILLFFYVLVRNTITDEVSVILESSLHEKTANLGQWLDDLENDVRAFASFSHFRSLLKTQEIFTSESFNRDLDGFFGGVSQIYGRCFLEFRVFDTTGFLLYPTEDRESVGHHQEVLASLTQGRPVLVEQPTDSSAAPSILWLCAPIGQNGKPWMGILAARLNLEMLVRLFDDPALAVSGKAYLIDDQHRTITLLRNPPTRISEQIMTSEAVSLALAGETGVKRYRDYRGVEVIGAFTYLPTPGWGVVIEQDADKAFAGLRRLRRNAFFWLGVLAVGSIAFSLVMANWVVHRLEWRDRQTAQRSEQMIAADKLSTAGVMAASVAHEINNPLTTINVLIHNLYEEAPPDEPRRMDLNIALDEIAKIKNIILRFLEFARPQEPEFSEVNVNEVLHRYGQLMRHQTAAKNLELVERPGRDVPSIVADPSQLGQVLLNILLNAIEATPVNGTIEMSTDYGPDRGVSVRIFNTGPVLKPGLYEKIFEPFFSTKAQGTGLGLSIARMIVERHGGTISAKPVPGMGTQFLVTLPVEKKRNSRGESSGS